MSSVFLVLKYIHSKYTLIAFFLVRKYSGLQWCSRLRYIKFHARASHFFIRSDGSSGNYFHCSGLSFLFHDHEYTLNSLNISLALCSTMSTITFEPSCVILNTLSSNTEYHYSKYFFKIKMR